MRGEATSRHGAADHPAPHPPSPLAGRGRSRRGAAGDRSLDAEAGLLHSEGTVTAMTTAGEAAAEAAPPFTRRGEGRQARQ